LFSHSYLFKRRASLLRCKILCIFICLSLWDRRDAVPRTGNSANFYAAHKKWAARSSDIPANAASARLQRQPIPAL